MGGLWWIEYVLLWLSFFILLMELLIMFIKCFLICLFIGIVIGFFVGNIFILCCKLLVLFMVIVCMVFLLMCCWIFIISFLLLCFFIFNVLWIFGNIKFDFVFLKYILIIGLIIWEICLIICDISNFFIYYFFNILKCYSMVSCVFISFIINIMFDIWFCLYR